MNATVRATARATARASELRAAALASLCCLVWLSAMPAIAADAEKAWPLAGQQGMVRFVIVPTELATDREAYARQVQMLCEPGATCFLNFYTNSTAAPVALPLADAIERESTAVFRRSAKQGAQRFMWRCSLKLAAENCF
jgi:hypothetical protein